MGQTKNKKNKRTSRKRHFWNFTHNKRSQVRMSETIAVLFIFFVLLLFGILFYYKYSQISFKEEQEAWVGKKAGDATLKALFLPELACSRGGAVPESNCFDLMKLKRAITVLDENFVDYYYDLFPFVKITVEKIYPVEEEPWTLYDKPKTKKLADGTIVDDWEFKEKAHFVVTLKDETKSESEGMYGIGILVVEAYG